MVIDAAKGIESQTRKLFEVCRLRDVPIITFINKMDREGRDPFELLDEIRRRWQLDVTPASWPIGMGRTFRGCYDLVKRPLVLMRRAPAGRDRLEIKGLDDPKLDDDAEARESRGSATRSRWRAV
jgi:peptide chain release factor 3